MFINHHICNSSTCETKNGLLGSWASPDKPGFQRKRSTWVERHSRAQLGIASGWSGRPAPAPCGRWMGWMLLWRRARMKAGPRLNRLLMESKPWYIEFWDIVLNMVQFMCNEDNSKIELNIKWHNISFNISFIMTRLNINHLLNEAWLPVVKLNTGSMSVFQSCWD